MKRLLALLCLFVVLVGPLRPAQAATTVAEAFGTSTSLTVNSTSWTNLTTISTTALDVSSISNPPVDILVTVNVTFPNSTMGDLKAVNIYLSGSEDGTNYDDNDQYAGTNNTQTALRSPSNFKGPVVLAATINVATSVTFSLRQVYGGVLPRKFGLILENRCNQTITTKTATYTAVNYVNN